MSGVANRCGRERVTLISGEGQILAWGPVVKADRVTTSAGSVSESRVVGIHVGRSPLSGTTRCLAASLFALLQKLGLCPLDVKTLDHLTEPSMLCGPEEWMSSYHSGEV